MDKNARGRGRGRNLQQEQGQDGSPPPVRVGEAEGHVEAVFQAMYVTEGVPAPTDGDRGRSRGRGVGRGTRGPIVPIPIPRGVEAENPNRMLELEARYGDDEENVAAPESLKEQEAPVLDRTPPAEVAVPVISMVEKAESIGNGQAASISSHGPVSTCTSRKKEATPEQPIVSRIGTKGDPVDVQTNYIRLKLQRDHPGVVEYHVSIEPNADHVGWRRKILKTQQCLEKLGMIQSFDGMILFLPHILPNDVTIVETTMPDQPDTILKVQVTFVRVREMKDAIVFFNVLLHRIMRELEFKELRREFYDVEKAVSFNQHKLEIWPGYGVTSENQEDGLMVCVDYRNRVLRQDSVYDYLKTLQGDPNMRAKFDQFIVNKIVITKYNYRTYKIDEVEWDMQPTTKFVHRKKEISFVEYLRSRYPDSDEVTNMKQPMLISKLKPRKNDAAGSEPRLAALVPQLCYVTGLSEEQKANFKVMTDLAQSTRLVPAQRVRNLHELIQRISNSPIATKILDDWGLYLEKEIIEVRGRRVDGPNLEFNKRIQLQKAPPDFSREAGKGVIDPITVRNYKIICTERDRDKAEKFIDVYREVAGPLGIKMLQSGEIVYVKGMKPSDFSDALKKHCNPSNVHFVVIIMPMSRDDVYSAIKRHCISNVPIPSQCIVSKTLANDKRRRSIVLKIALQINCKLGGALWGLRMPLKEEIMFIGIDAAHDPLKKDASVICLVASLNNECTKYFSKSSSSKVHQELADSLGGMTTDAIKAFYQTRGKYPNRIVVFRDGGSIGALDVIGTSEVDQMRKATKICGEELKHFTFVVVTKRISQRFFAKTGRETVGNPPPGTVVDSIVTRRHIYDYYVISQQVREGTVNPTHFVVVDSDDPIRPDLIQKLSYVTCFMYYNWSGTVRIPAMVQYAHKLSALLLKHVKTTPHADITHSLYYL